MKNKRNAARRTRCRACSTFGVASNAAVSIVTWDTAGGGSYKSPQKQLGVSHSLGDLSHPSPSLARASASRLEQMAHPPGPVVPAVPETFREGMGGSRPVYLDWMVATFEVGPQKIMLPTLSGRHAGSVVSTLLVAARLGKEGGTWAPRA